LAIRTMRSVAVGGTVSLATWIIRSPSFSQSI
jgi:hypothetical protein